MKELDLRGPVRSHLEAQGYRVYFDPDGTDYFDTVAVRGREVGLVELKLADWRKVFAQAQVRRGWGDWVAVMLPRRSLATKVLGLPAPPRSRRVGVWCWEHGKVEVLREAAREADPDVAGPFAGWKGHLLEVLEARERGLLPEGTQWRVLRPPRRGGPARRPFDPRVWHLEEFEEGPPGDG